MFTYFLIEIDIRLYVSYNDPPLSPYFKQHNPKQSRKLIKYRFLLEYFMPVNRIFPPLLSY